MEIMESAGMSRSWRVAIVQSGSLTGDAEADLAALLDLFRMAAEGSDVVIFPELATTPYFGATGDDRYLRWAQPVDGPAVIAFRSAARAADAAVIVGFYERADDDVHYNSAVVIDRRGEVVSGRTLDGDSVRTYRKTSIPQGDVSGIPVDEKRFFAPGPGPAVFQLDGVALSCLICYDRTFPEYWLGSRALGAQVVVPLVSSMGFREALFQAELQVRALATQTWVLAANRGGPETVDGRVIHAFGLSCAIDPTGALIASAPAHEAGHILRVEVDLRAVEDARARLALARDRRPELLEKTARILAGDVQAAAR
jgi:N-carbamoylputrescine amidase